MKITPKIIGLFFLFIPMLIFSCYSMTTKEFLEQELSIKLLGKISLETKQDIDFGFTGDFTKLRVYNIKEKYYEEIEQAAINKKFTVFDHIDNLPFIDDLFLEYIEGGRGLYKLDHNGKDYKLIILNEKNNMIIYFFIHT